MLKIQQGMLILLFLHQIHDKWQTVPGTLTAKR